MQMRMRDVGKAVRLSAAVIPRWAKTYDLWGLVPVG